MTLNKTTKLIHTVYGKRRRAEDQIQMDGSQIPRNTLLAIDEGVLKKWNSEEEQLY
jgi:hypothetical protein